MTQKRHEPQKHTGCPDVRQQPATGTGSSNPVTAVGMQQVKDGRVGQTRFSKDYITGLSLLFITKNSSVSQVCKRNADKLRLLISE